MKETSARHRFRYSVYKAETVITLDGHYRRYVFSVSHLCLVVLIFRLTNVRLRWLSSMILHAGKLSLKFSNGSYQKKKKKQNKNWNTRALSCLSRNGTYLLFNQRTYYYLSPGGEGRCILRGYHGFQGKWRSVFANKVYSEGHSKLTTDKINKGGSFEYYGGGGGVNR